MSLGHHIKGARGQRRFKPYPAYKDSGVEWLGEIPAHWSVQHPDTAYTVEAHKRTHGVAYDTARKDLLGLVAKGFLKKQREGKRLLVFYPSARMMEKLRSGQPRKIVTK